MKYKVPDCSGTRRGGTVDNAPPAPPSIARKATLHTSSSIVLKSFKPESLCQPTLIFPIP
ncbi:hypothetical protein ACHAXS_008708 [Conticribra weissflogii]